MSAAFNDRGPFAVGEACVIVVPIPSSFLHGLEVTIITVGESMRDSRGACFAAHKIAFRDVDATAIVPEHFLRRRKPPTTGEQSILSLFVTTPKREGIPA